MNHTDAGIETSEVEQLRAENSRLRVENEALGKQATRLRRLMETNMLGIMVFDVEWHVIEVNNVFANMLGYSANEFKAQPLDWSKILPESEIPRAKANWESLWKTGICDPWETTMLDTEGKQISVVTASALIQLQTDGDKAQCVTWALDVSSWKQAQTALRESEALSRCIIESLYEGLLITDLDDVVIHANQRMCELSGYTVDELKGNPAYTMLAPPESWSTIRQQTQNRSQGQSSRYEIQLLRKDGSEWWAMVNGTPLYDGEGRIIGTIGAQSDVTQSRVAEEEARLFAEKLELSNHELQTFAYAVSHDLKEPLRKIEAFGSRLERNEGAKLSEESRDYLRRMRSAASRMFGLIDGLLDYSRVSTGGQPFRQVNLNDVFKATVSDLEIAIERSGATVKAEDLPVINGDVVQLRQLMQNLVANSLRYAREDVPVVVEVEGWKRKGRCGFSVRDNGKGFENRYADKIFDIFSRLDPGATEGSGVGLTICRKIVDRHSGKITATAKPNEGATFSVEFPACGN